MNDGFINKFISKFKNKFNRGKNNYQDLLEYAFSDAEIESINKENRQKIQELKQDIFSVKKENKVTTEEVLSKMDSGVYEEEKITTTDNSEIINSDIEEETLVIDEEEKVIDKNLEVGPKNSFINLSDEAKAAVMNAWKSILSNKIDKDIMDAKDLFSRNYTITYADEALKFIQYIRKEYEVVICYLIGFNNEKQGIYDKTFFADKIENEWKFFNSYIKLLEKIRKNK